MIQFQKRIFMTREERLRRSLSKPLDPRALYNPMRHIAADPGGEWHTRKTFSEQWARMGKEGLTDVEVQEGLKIAEKLDGLYEKHRRASGRMVSERLRAK